jgi:outer membrane protein assembly factor BamE (lipoprotein component of BamABCDE complex)
MKSNRTKKAIHIILLLTAFSSCSKKTVPLADGRMVTQGKYNRMIQHVLKTAEKEARKSVKGKMSRKQIREFENYIR